MKYSFRLTIVLLTSLIFYHCSWIGTNNSSSNNRSSLTGWNFNDPKYGGYIKGPAHKKQPIPEGMVAIEGGTFTMGSVQDDVMGDWNTTPRQMHVRSFYMDEAEVTNSEYLLYLQVTKDVFPPSEEKYKHIYEAALPDTLVWRKTLANTDLLSESYLRHPAYADYPVVGVSWLQAMQYCKWRTNAINLKKLIDKGVIANVLEVDSIRNFYDTEVYLKDPYLLFDGDSTVYKKGVPNFKDKSKTKGAFTGRHVSSMDGILAQKFRLPTEAEWEFAAKAYSENREYNNIRGRKKYPWKERYSRNRSKKYRGDQLANFKQGKGNYSGVSGWSSDGADIPNKIKSYPPNAFGLYDMSGNVAEWVADVYRPIVDSDASDFGYFRGNIYTKRIIDENGKVSIVGKSNEDSAVYDTLPNGKIVVKQLPGTVKHVPITKADAFMRTNYYRADNTNTSDGDRYSSRFYSYDEIQFATAKEMYNSPKKPKLEIDSLTGNVVERFDKEKRTTLISDESRVYKGGSWKDREFWLDPAQRRYLPQYMATNFIGFRCAADMLGGFSSKKVVKN